MDREGLKREAAKLRIELNEAQLDQFEAFEEDLYAYNESKNLTRVPREECWTRHFLESLLVANFMCEDERTGALLDIGTGPGFPAWPLACALPELKVTAMDSNSKMLEFLRRHPLPNLEIVDGRAEEMRRSNHFDVVTGRALAPLSAQLEVSADYAKIGRKVLPMRTPNDDLEAPKFKLLGLELGTVETLTLPGTDVQRTFPIYWKRRATPGIYPRRWSEIKKKPL